MAKRLVICCDGTWNIADQPNPTNVTKVALAVAPVGGGVEQRVLYHRGVGTGRWDRFTGGALGLGLSRNVRDVYRFLVQNFEPGDELFFFGFSRGAYTARSAVGLVRNCGILRRRYIGQIDEAYALYRSRNARTHPNSVGAELFRRSYSHETDIHFVGVWDTVGALGIPMGGLRLVNLVNRRWEFHDIKLSKSVKAAFQALAIDEKRGPFKPSVWEPQSGAPNQVVEQVWFAGVHCDVGGGYAVPPLSEIPLQWMVHRAESRGLVFNPGAFPSLAANSWSRPLHDSRTWFYKLVPPFTRPLGVKDPQHEYAASSAVERRTSLPGYAPANLATYNPSPAQTMDVGVPTTLPGA